MKAGSSLNRFIAILQKSRLYAECPHCYTESKLSDFLLFDGRGAFPAQAEERRAELESELKESRADLAKRRKDAQTRSETAAATIGIGTMVEKILPAHRDFPIVPADCRFIAEPIDMMVFHGASKNKIDRITFMEIKTGMSKLNAHQKQIRDAVEDRKVKWKVL